MKIAITGHRPNKLDNDYDLSGKLVKAIKVEIVDILLEELKGPTPTPVTLISGMALGIDTLFAEIALEAKLPFIAAIPFKGQESRWPWASQQKYYNLLTKANKIVIVDRGLEFKSYADYIAEEPTFFSGAKMQRRNIWMVDNCDKLIAVWDGSAGGTANCVQYATLKQKPISLIDPNIVRDNLAYSKEVLEKDGKL